MIPMFKKTEIIVLLACLVCVTLFFTISINSIALAILLVYCAFGIKPRKIIYVIRNSVILKIVLSYYGMHLLAMLYTTDSTAGFFVLEKKASFLLVPLILPAVLIDKESAVKFIIRFFSFVGVASGVILVGWAFYKRFALQDLLAFHFENFTPFNYVYYALYFTCASLFVLVEISTAPNKRLGLFASGGLMIYALIILFLVSSKIGIVSFTLGSVFIFYKSVSLNTVLLFLIFLIAALSLLLVFHKTTRDRFMDLNKNLEVLHKNKFAYNEPFTGLTLRLVFWKIAVSESWEKGMYLFGAGTGDAQDFLDAGYAKYNLNAGGFTGWDPHNQWVYTFVQLGAVGLLLLAGIFFSGIRQAVIQPDLQLLSFLLVSFLFCFTESILETNKGIIFFALFISLFAARSLHFSSTHTLPHQKLI